ncbi:suppressor of cytokine signaling 7 [Phymastichus coffea]|uniref:suppressor of cytokine signaling 7 n=1 Tax=Phymastichus coffea TaxID=108790 RepID=UPI00273AE017|nr:suppressor of cytokine signaling 7 [Phymastichus coffea]
MGQHLASLRMDSSTTGTGSCCSGGGDRQREPVEASLENNGNVVLVVPVVAVPKLGNLDNEQQQLNFDFDNHNSRFESLYSQPIDAGQCNGNFIDQQQPQQLQLEVYNKAQEACCNSSGSNASSSSEDSPVNPVLRRSSKTLSFGKRKVNKQLAKSQNPTTCNHVLSSKKKRNNWVLKLSCAKSKASKNTDIPGGQANGASECVCTGYRRTEEHPMGAGTVFNTSKSAPQSPVLGPLPPSPVIDLSRFNPEEFPMEDCDARARLQRAREMEEGVEPPPGYRPNCQPASGIQVHPNGITVDSLAALFQAHAGIQAAALTALSQIDSTLISNIYRPIHTQVDYVHCLVPDLQAITACSFYWGKMDRYEAERLLEGKQEGTFLLRDSAQEEFLFSVSFRKYDRSLHARIEQWNHKFSFDSHDPGVYASETVCGLIEHYKDPSCCMFFEPLLTIPLHRNFAFPLQHLCRAVITSRCTYDGINKLQLPKTLKTYLKEYHYKQRVRIRRLDIESDLQSADGKSISYLPLM